MHSSKIRMFISLNRRTMLLFLEALLTLGWARILIYYKFSKVAPSLGSAMQETSNTFTSPMNAVVIKSVSNAIGVMSKYTFWDSKCLVKAIAGMKMLARRKIDCTLFLGTARDDSGKMIAHAWLQSGPYYVTGKEGMEKFTVVGKFAKRACGVQREHYHKGM